MADLPIGTYTSHVDNQPALGGRMTLSGSNTSPSLSYKGVSLNGATWDANSATLSFSFQGWSFSGTYDTTAGAFSGTASNGATPENDVDHWGAEKTGEEEVAVASSGRE